MSNSKHTFAFPRRVTPGSCLNLAPKKGVGNAGCLRTRSRVIRLVTQPTSTASRTNVRDDHDTPLKWDGMGGYSR